MKTITFITGNQNKADYLAKYIGIGIDHKKIDLEEIQSLDLKTIVEHKVRQAYEVIKSPVLVEDASLEFCAFGRLPGPFIKYYLEEMPQQTICNMLNGFDRKAIARTIYGYYDGDNVEYFEGRLVGAIATKPAGNGGYGWDRIFIPTGYNITRASLNEVDNKITYLKIKPLEKIKQFLISAV